jgi:transcription elongation factor GreA
MVKKVFVTLEKFKNLKQEIKILKTKERKDIADKLSEYRDSVDLVEDTSYTDLLQEQADLEEKITEIEGLLETASIIKESKAASKVRVGSTVVIRAVGSQKKTKIQIVGSVDADPEKNSISNESPLGTTLLGRKKDDIVELELPTGTIKYKIVDIL